MHWMWTVGEPEVNIKRQVNGALSTANRRVADTLGGVLDCAQMKAWATTSHPRAPTVSQEFVGAASLGDSARVRQAERQGGRYKFKARGRDVPDYPTRQLA